MDPIASYGSPLIRVSVPVLGQFGSAEKPRIFARSAASRSASLCETAMSRTRSASARSARSSASTVARASFDRSTTYGELYHGTVARTYSE